ncbi:GIY-YIG nuclease family protein [Azoarcus olearius]|uniref:GIY-YIG nuclease family protein n=1 Tax=Azoarcus sp. (strain BH72) TaxID=418699 RepID=UPI0011D250D6|nr:GIY-YIG nuclease family protein [Azoarcus olearius]
MDDIRNWYIYILKLEQDCWYIGTAKGLRSRLRAHGKKSPHSSLKKKGNFRYMDCGLTGKRKVTHLHAAFRSVGDCVWLTEIENSITVAMAIKYGFDRVRGGSIIHSWDRQLSNEEIDNLKQRYGGTDIRSKYNLIEMDLKSEKNFVFPLTNRRGA